MNVNMLPRTWSEEEAQLKQAIRLSELAEQTKKDEELAAKLQAQEQAARPTAPVMLGTDGCAVCHRGFGPGQRYLQARGKRYHTWCFVCRGCGKPIEEPQYCTGPSKDDASTPNVYHQACYTQVYAPQCDVCNCKILPDTSGSIRYKVTPFWQQKFCPQHESDGTNQCYACKRMENKREPHIPLEEGMGTLKRTLCVSCAESVVADEGDVKVLYRDMRTFFATLNIRLPEDLPVYLVASQALNEANCKHGHGNTMGVTLSEQYVTVRHFQGSPLPFWKRTAQQESRIVSKRNEVSAILILYGLPRLQFCSVLAHECTHAFFRLASFPEMEPKVEEGICQLLSCLWLRHEKVQGIHEKEKTFFLNQIFEDTSEAYGEGFRSAFAIYEKYGLPAILNHVKLSGVLPI